MSYSIYNPCGDEVVAPVCDPCLVEMEHGGVRGVGLIHKNYIATLKANPTLKAVWVAGVAAGAIFIIPETQGTFDGGAPVEVPGFGDQLTRITGYNFGAAFKDPNFKGNTAFYNSIIGAGNYHFAWRTETQSRISNKPVAVLPKSPVQEGLQTEVMWDVEIKWFESKQPVPFDTPDGVFVCI